MIVVDTNLIAYLFLPGDHTPEARRAFERDSAWIAPLLWRSEFRNVLATSLHKGHLSLVEAGQAMELALELMDGGEFEVNTTNVLALAATSRCSAYDCEFVSLARELRVPLVTADRRILSAFPSTAVELTEFGR